MPGILEQRLASSKHKEEPQGDTRQEGGRVERPEIQQRSARAFNGPSGIRQEEQREEPPALSPEELEEIRMIEEIASQDSYLKLEKRRKHNRLIGNVILTVLCVYLTILIYGTVLTEFHYNDKGEIAPVVFTVQDIEERNEFTLIASYYLQCRTLYEEILTLDYRVASNIENLMGIAPEYEQVIQRVNYLESQIDGAANSARYSQVMSMLYTWVGTHVFNYCRYMSIAISQNDQVAQNEAIAARQYVESTFQLITQNVVSLGSEIKGIDIQDLKDWSPEGYVMSEIEGIS